MFKVSKKYIIAIDGPSATGKSTTAKILAKKLSIVYIDTGAMYRASAYYFISNNIKINEENTIKHMKDINIELKCSDSGMIILLNNEDITNKIRTAEISMGASDISKIGIVREKLVEMQRKLGNECSCVMDGRDIGSVVFPEADLKIYLDADSKIRAKRRQKDLEKAGQIMELNEIEHDIQKRDIQDMSRENSPLIRVDDAIVIDTTKLTAEEVAEYIILLLKNKKL